MTTTTAYQLKYNRSSVHIAGITERTQVSGDGMNYAQSACPTLTRSMNFVTKTGSDDLVEALEMARLTARVQGLKVCKHCEKAAEKEIAEQPVTEVAEAQTPATRKLGKAQRRVLDFLSARPGQTMVVSLIVKGLEAEGIKTWFRATNDALAKLAADPTSGIVEVTGGNKAYKFER